MPNVSTVGLCICFALVVLPVIGQSHATVHAASSTTSTTSSTSSSGSTSVNAHAPRPLASSSTLKQRGEAMLAQIKQSSACSFNGMNFSSLTRFNGTDYTYSSQDNHYTWTINVCANTIAPCQGDSTQSPGVWNYDFQQPYACFNLANPTTANWSTVTVSGQPVTQLAYTGGDACYNVQPASTYTLAIQFIYNQNTPGQLVNVVNGATQCDFVATFLTNVAPPAPPVPSGVPTVHEVTPTSGPLTSPTGSTIFVIGSAFQNVTTLACLFGNFVPAVAIFHKVTVLECVLPTVPEPGKALVQITNDGKTYSSPTDQVFFTFM